MFKQLARIHGPGKSFYPNRYQNNMIHHSAIKTSRNAIASFYDEYLECRMNVKAKNRMQDLSWVSRRPSILRIDCPANMRNSPKRIKDNFLKANGICYE